MRTLARAFADASVILLALSFARPAPADDFKFGIGGGATFTTRDIIFSSDFKTGWNVTGRALWFPSGFFLGVRGAGYYGQTSPMTASFQGTAVHDGTLAGGDLNLAIRLIGKGAEGLYLNAGTGVRSYRQDVETSPGGKWTYSDTNTSFNGGLGFSSGWFFTEANVVYFKVQNSDFVSVPLTVGFQF